MTMEVSDVFGLLGSLCLLVAPARDQWLRYRAARNAARADNDLHGLGGLRRMVSEGFQSERNAYSGHDTAIMAAGALLLALSYVIQH